MKVTLTSADLIAFEDDVCKHFADKKIRAPVHADDGNETQLVHIFNHYVDENDWICGSWRQHFKCLLKGVPKEELMQFILDGKSISLCFPKYNIISSAIVGGILPVAVGIALGIKRKGNTNKVVCFLGEMTSETGAFHEAYKYSVNHDLPVLWIIECNHKSVCTPTLDVWNMKQYTYRGGKDWYSFVPILRANSPTVVFSPGKKLLWYEYQSRYPHAGFGQRIQF